MINQEFKALGRKHQVLPNFEICCRELGGPKLRFFVHSCAVSALSVVNKPVIPISLQTLKRAHDGYSPAKYSEKRRSLNINQVMLGDSRPIRLARVHDDVTVYPEEFDGPKEGKETAQGMRCCLMDIKLIICGGRVVENLSLLKCKSGVVVTSKLHRFARYKDISLALFFL